MPRHHLTSCASPGRTRIRKSTIVSVSNKMTCRSQRKSSQRKSNCSGGMNHGVSLYGILCPYTLPKRRRSGFKVLEGYTDTKYLGHIGVRRWEIMIRMARMGGTRTRHPASFHDGVEVFFRPLLFRNLKVTLAAFYPKGTSFGRGRITDGKIPLRESAAPHHHYCSNENGSTRAP